ncbi:MAG TPA: hypothetical protein VE033_02215 [Acetobacteraceae bacterium]|nr:hypothetical protein [Acetobacteraceae bacterium]
MSLPAPGLVFTLGLLLAVPLCVGNADPALSAWLPRLCVAATPEERGAGAA